MPGRFRLRTGVNGSTAVASVFVAFQTWAFIVFGFVITVAGSVASSLTDDFSSGSNDYYYYYDSGSYETAHTAANVVSFIGVAMIIVGIGLLAGLIALLMANRAGRGIVLTLEVIVIIFNVILSVVAKEGYLLVGSIVPVIVVACISGGGTRRLLADHDLGQASPHV